jgi:cell volume regulation protein A
MAIDPQTYLIAFGIIILIAFLGHVIFQRTKAPDVILLIFLGALLGPLFPRLPGNPAPLLDPEIFNQLVPLLGAVAIIIILFDGGLKLNLKDLFGGVAPATLLSLLGFIASMFLVGGILYQFGVVANPAVALIFGAIVGGTSSIVVMPIVEKMSVGRQTKTIVGLESALTDVLVVVVAVTLSVGVAASNIAPDTLLQTLAANFAIALAMGLIGGFLWVRYLRMFTQRSYEYMLTLAFLFLVYAVTEFLQGSGALAVLTFGLVLGNSKKQDKLSGQDLQKARRRHDKVHRFVPVFTIDLVNLHNEIVFFIRAFFFVALGVILDLTVFFNARFVGLSIILLFGLVAARLWALTLVFMRSDLPDRDKSAIAFLMPRGLAAAALAAVPFTTYKVQDDIATVDDFVAFAVMILIMTNLVTTVGVYLFENQRFQARWRDWGERFRERRGEKNEERARSKAQKKAERAAAMDKKREARRR